mmetsp:Transcript_16855/g.34913  ORF Transcript_16855/g.34913 Transcript_16855/m.34913 type:complete len:103 (+) Transcript_16855:547-855(+)
MLYDGGVIFRGPIEDSFIGPITTYGGYSPAWFDGYIRRSNIGAIQIHETILASDGDSTLGPVCILAFVFNQNLEHASLVCGHFPEGLTLLTRNGAPHQRLIR